MFIEGKFLDGKTSKRHCARLEVNNQQVIIGIHLNDPIASIPVIEHSYVVHSRLGSAPQEISFSDNQLFISNDFESIKRLDLGNVERSFNDSNCSDAVLIVALLLAFKDIELAFVHRALSSAETEVVISRNNTLKILRNI